MGGTRLAGSELWAREGILMGLSCLLGFHYKKYLEPLVNFFPDEGVWSEEPARVVQYWRCRVCKAKGNYDR